MKGQWDNSKHLVDRVSRIKKRKCPVCLERKLTRVLLTIMKLGKIQLNQKIVKGSRK
jgi:hypothetical protein